MPLTKLQESEIRTAVGIHLPHASVKITPTGVTATIQGPLDGKALLGIVEDNQVATIPFSIYRSGTGLSIKFSKS